VAVNVPGSATQYFIEPIWARDSVLTDFADTTYQSLTPTEAERQGIGLIRAFDGSQWLRDKDITLQAKTNMAPASVKLHFDTNVHAVYTGTGFWLPPFDESDFSGLVTYPNDGAIDSIDGTGLPGNLWNFSISGSHPKVKSVSSFDFFFTFNGITPPLYAARLDIPYGTAVPSNWYRLLKPFSFDIHDIKTQVGKVTIMNNVIDPEKGETARLSYILKDSGTVTIQVFNLAGDLVKTLYHGKRSAGDYSTSWDGKNSAGRVVARGIYFIRVVAPGVDEYRKVMVIKD
jgi:hypothetical protein